MAAPADSLEYCLATQVDSHVEKQPLFPEPKRVRDTYAAGEDSGEDAGKVRF